jgi:5-hydroxyisourate hydrolase-like protein (transthyretin family)
MQNKVHVDPVELKKRQDALLKLLEEKQILSAEEIAGLPEVTEKIIPVRQYPHQERRTGNDRRNHDNRSNRRSYSQGGGYQASRKSPNRRDSQPQEIGNRGNGGTTVNQPRGHLTGIVRNRLTGKPVVGVNVILKRGMNADDQIQFRTTKTDMEGKYYFLNIPLAKGGDQFTPAGDFYEYSLDMTYRKSSFSGRSALRLTQNQTAVFDLELDLPAEE